MITGKNMKLTSKNPVTIQVYGHQWWWEVNILISEPTNGHHRE